MAMPVPFAGRPTPPILVLFRPALPLVRGRIHLYRNSRSLGVRLRPSLPQSSFSSRRWQSTTTLNTATSPTTKTPSPAARTAPFFLLAGFCFALGFAMAVTPAVTPFNQLKNPPTDEETLTLFTPDSSDAAASEIEAALWTHPLVKSLIADPKYKASRPHLKLPPAMRSRSLTAGTLMGADKVAVPPLAFSTEDGSHYVSIQHLGDALCGHPGLVHGGMLATLLDEGLARCCFPALPNKVGVTASLKVEYRKPCLANSFVVLRAETTKVEGRKAWVKGRLETLVDESAGEQPAVIVEAEALFVEPKQAAALAAILPLDNGKKA